MPTTYSVCNACLALNRFDSARAASPICGRCKKLLSLNGAVTEASDNGLKRFIELSPIPVVVDFWAPWCAPCRAFAPAFATVAKLRLGKIAFAKINTQAETNVGQSYGIRGIPTLIVFFKGKEIARTSGALDQRSLERWLDEVLQSP